MVDQRWSKCLTVLSCVVLVACASVFPNLLATPKAYAADATLTANASSVVAPMNEEMYGTNIGLWTAYEFHPVSTRSVKYVNLLKEAGITMIRFPAGSESDETYWDRSNTYDQYSGPGAYHKSLTADMLDSFMSLAQEVGAEPLITVNARINDKLMAADIVRYANIEKGYDIKYWEIGNEPEFYSGAYATNPTAVAARIQEYAMAMKAVDPSINIVGPANAQPSQLASWTKPTLSTLKNNNHPVDAISVHWYPLDGAQTNTGSSAYPTISNLLAYEGTNWQNSYMSWANKFTDTTPTDNLINYRNTYAPGALIGITELGQVTSAGQGIADTLAGAIWLGDIIPRLAYHKVDFLTQFLFQGEEQTYALMNYAKTVRPAYYVYPLLTRYFGDNLLSSTSSDNQNFSIWTSTRTGVDNKLYMMVINKNQTQNLSATINIANFTPQSTASTWVLNAPAINSLSGANINGVQVASNGTLPVISGNTITGVSSNFTRTFPAHSITMIELTSSGSTTPPTPSVAVAYNVTSSITANGNLSESAWSVDTPVTKVISGTPNNTATFDVMWDSSYLYVGAKVLDGNLHNDSTNPWDDDSVEIYVDPGHNHATTYDSNDRQFIKGYNDSTIVEKNNNTTGVLHGWSAITGGYSVELAIPWSNLGITPSGNMTIGLDIGINDDDNNGARDSQSIWQGTGNNWTNTSAFGDATLSTQTVGSTQSPITISNSGFEQPVTSNFQMGPMTHNWAFNTRAGVQKNGSAFGATTAPQGVQTAVLQSVNGVQGEITQAVTFTAGSYTVSFQAAKRTSFGGTQSFDVYMDSTLIGSFAPTLGSYTTYTTNSFVATAGNHTIKFVGTSSTGDNTAFIDNVTVQ